MLAVRVLKVEHDVQLNGEGPLQVPQVPMHNLHVAPLPGSYSPGLQGPGRSKEFNSDEDVSA
jgi:hypothetical protein